MVTLKVEVRLGKFTSKVVDNMLSYQRDPEFQQRTKWNYSTPHCQMVKWKWAQDEEEIKTKILETVSPVPLEELLGEVVSSVVKSSDVSLRSDVFSWSAFSGRTSPPRLLATVPGRSSTRCPIVNVIKLLSPSPTLLRNTLLRGWHEQYFSTCGLYYYCAKFTIYECNDSGLYHKITLLSLTP